VKAHEYVRGVYLSLLRVCVLECVSACVTVMTYFVFVSVQSSHVCMRGCIRAVAA
jgi:hypothetical protein